MQAEPANLIYTAIRHAVLAGALRHHAARDERIARGFTRAAELQSARSAATLAAFIEANLDAGGGDL